MAKTFQCIVNSIIDETIFTLDRTATPLHIGNLFQKVCNENIEDRILNNLRMTSFELVDDRFYCSTLQFKILDHQKPLKGEDDTEDLIKIDEDLYRVSYWIYDAKVEFLYYISQRGSPKIYEFNRYLNHFIDFYNSLATTFYMDEVQIEKNKLFSIEEILADFKSVRSFELTFDLHEFDYATLEDSIKDLYLEGEDNLGSEMKSLLDKSKESIQQAKSSHLDFYTAKFTMDKNNEIFKNNKRHLAELVKYLNFQNDRLSEITVEGKYKTGNFEKKKLKSIVYVVYQVELDYTYIKEDKFFEVYHAIILSIKGGNGNEQIQANI